MIWRLLHVKTSIVSRTVMLPNGDSNKQQRQHQQNESFVYLNVYNVSLGIESMRRVLKNNGGFETIVHFEELFDFIASNKNVLQWNQLDFDEKIDKYKYREYLSHELQLFIFENGLNFFYNVCLNHIRSKLYCDINDHIFLNNTNKLLSYIASGHQFTKFNLFEQIVILDYFNK